MAVCVCVCVCVCVGVGGEGSGWSGGTYKQENTQLCWDDGGLITVDLRLVFPSLCAEKFRIIPLHSMMPTSNQREVRNVLHAPELATLLAAVWYSGDWSVSIRWFEVFKGWLELFSNGFCVLD